MLQVHEDDVNVPKRELGMFNGKYYIPEDIDDCNDEVLALMEGE